MLQENDASKVYSRRMKTKVLVPKEGNNFIFPFGDGSAKVAGKVLKTEHPTKFCKILKRAAIIKEKRTKQIVLVQHQAQDEVESKHDFWSTSGSFIHVIMSKTNNFFCATENLISNPTQVFDVCQADHLNIGRIAGMPD